jgi:glycosyltransferase involved in cell wall biosynthesis
MGKIYKQYFKKQDNFSDKDSIISNIVFEAKLEFSPKYTIAIPTFRRTDLLKEAVDSALNQANFDNYEVIVVDNDPTVNNEPEKLMKQYNSSRLSYYKNSQNLGSCGNWNRLYLLAKGEWVIMLHDDDLLKPFYLTEINKLVDNFSHKYSVFFPIYTILRNGEDYFNNSKVRNYTKMKLASIEENDFLYGNMIGNPIGMCIRKKDMIDSGGFRETYYPSFDLDFFIYFSHKFKICRIIDYNSLCEYRLTDNAGSKLDLIKQGIQKDFEMKTAIADKYFFIIKRIWRAFFIQSAYYSMKTALNFFNYDGNILDGEIKNLGYNPNIFTLLIYKVIKNIRKIFFKRSMFQFYLEI